MRLLLTLAALAMLSMPALAAERPPAFPTAPAFPTCDTIGCTCAPCACAPCDCLAKAAVLLTTGVVGEAVPTQQSREDLDRRVESLERQVKVLREHVFAYKSPAPFPAPADAPVASGRYVTRQVCNGGSCQLVQEWVPDVPAVVQASGRTYGDHFIDTDQQPGGGSAPAIGAGCAGGVCGSRGGLSRGEPVLRINGGPGVIRSVFGCR